jgi:hypothetical protein
MILRGFIVSGFYLGLVRSQVSRVFWCDTAASRRVIPLKPGRVRRQALSQPKPNGSSLPDGLQQSLPVALNLLFRSNGIFGPTKFSMLDRRHRLVGGRTYGENSPVCDDKSSPNPDVARYVGVTT